MKVPLTSTARSCKQLTHLHYATLVFCRPQEYGCTMLNGPNNFLLGRTCEKEIKAWVCALAEGTDTEGVELWDVRVVNSFGKQVQNWRDLIHKRSSS